MHTATTSTRSGQPDAARLPRRVRVMIVDDSRVIRDLLSHTVAGDPRFEVVATVESGEAALHALHRVKPDVISLDIRLPGIDGFEVTRRIMSQRATPIVIVAGDIEHADLRISINALTAGALSVLEKPLGATLADLQAFGQRLCAQLAIMSQVKVVTRRERARAAAIRPPPRGAALRPAARSTYEMVGIVASTGGPNALLEILKALGTDFPVPILIVQHITSTFSQAFIEWLDDVCPMAVIEAQHGLRPDPAHVYVAPADRHLVLRDRRLYLDETPPIGQQRPSGTALLASMAHDLRSTALGVVLTGMGDDGAAGLQAIRAADGYTIAEDESTAVVYGMPRAAVEIGAACESLPLPRIGPRLLELIGGREGHDGA